MTNITNDGRKENGKKTNEEITSRHGIGSGIEKEAPDMIGKMTMTIEVTDDDMTGLTMTAPCFYFNIIITDLNEVLDRGKRQRQRERHPNLRRPISGLNLNITCVF